MERRTTLPGIQDAPFGYRFLHTSSSGRSETIVYPQGNVRRAVVPSSKCIKEVPSLENVSAFLSDPLNVEEDATPKDRMQVPEKPTETGEERSEEWIDDVDPAKILRLVDRTLSSAWKFNPYLGASPGAMGPFPEDLELTPDEFDFANRKKIIKDTASERRIRADTARGLFELQNINKRNKKNLSIKPWPEDISFLNDKAFTEQVNLNAFYSRNSIPNDVSSRVHDTRDEVACDDRQVVFKDSAIHMEDEFQKEATKGSPVSSTRTEHELNEGTFTSSFVAPSPDEVDCEPSIPGELLQVLGHRTSGTARFGTIPATDTKSHTLYARLEEASIQTSLALFDNFNATLDGRCDGPPYDVRDLATSSKLERAMEDTLYLCFGTMHSHNLQETQQEGVGNEPPPTGTVFMGTPDGASLKTEVRVGPSPAPNVVYGPLGQAVSGYVNDTYGAETPMAPPSPSLGSFNSLGQRELASANDLPELKDWPAPSTDNYVHSNIRTPTCFVSQLPPGLPQASNIPDDNGSEGSIEVFSAPATVHKASPTSPETEATLRGTEVYFHDNGPYSTPTPMYPISVLPGQATDVANAFNVHMPNDSNAALYDLTPMIPEFFSPDAAAEIGNAAENFSRDIIGGRSANYVYSEPPSSASRQLSQDLYAAANGTKNANGVQSPIAPAWVLTPMGLEESIDEEYDFENGFLPATNRSATPYQSPYNNMSVEDGNQLHNDLQTSSPVINAHGRPRYGALRLPGYPAVARSDSYSSMENRPSLSPRDSAQNMALSEYIQANTAQPALSHADSNMSMEVNTGAAPGLGPRTPKSNEAPNTNFAAGARELAYNITRPSTPKNPSVPPYSLSPDGAALHLNMPSERQTSNRVLVNWGTPTPLPKSGAPIPIPNAGAPTPISKPGAPIPIPNAGAPIPMSSSGASATRPDNPPSPYDDAPAFSTRQRSRASSAASAASAASASTPGAPSGGEPVATPDTKTSKAKTPRRKSEAKNARRKSTSKTKSRSATPAAGKRGGRGRAQSVGSAQEGQPPKKRGRPPKKDDGADAGLA